MAAVASPTPGAVAALLANQPSEASDTPDLVVQVVDLKPIGSGSRFTFMASDGKSKVKAMLPTDFAAKVHSGEIQNLGLLRILDYTCNVIPNQPDKCVIVTKCEVVAPSLEQLVSDVKEEKVNLAKKPKIESAVKSASQIVNEQHSNAAPAARLAMTRRVHPLVSLNPYQGNWTIKVRVTSKGNLRSYKNARGEGHVFNVELTDEDGTQIQATMFNEAANKFYPKFELGKVYYISKGSLKIANKQFKTVQNDYEMNLNENAIVEEAEGEIFVPETKYNFIKIDQLGPYVNGRELVDVIGVVQSVSPMVSLRRKSDNETVPKRDITIADDSNKTVVLSLWNDLATSIGEKIQEIADESPIIAVKGLKVGDFQGVSLSTVGKSIVVIDPDLAETKKLRSWYDSEGKGMSLASVGADMGVAGKPGGARSMYADRVFLSHITGDRSLGEDKPVFFSLNVFVSLIRSDQPIWYRACKACNKKITDAVGSGYWCESCQKNDDQCALRYIMVMKVSDPTGEAWLSVFNEQAEKIIGCSADQLERIKNEEGDDKYQLKLKEAMWVPHLFRVAVTQSEYMSEKRQRITVRAQAPLDYSVESRFLLEEIARMMAT